MEYRYTECGLDNVVLVGIEVMNNDAGEDVFSIPNINGLHRVISKAILDHEHGMSGRELRFLRTEMGLTQDELGQSLYVTRLTISRWERAEVKMDSQAEFMVRMLAAEKLGLNDQISAQAMAKRCVSSATPQCIRIDGSTPGDYRPLLRAA